MLKRILVSLVIYTLCLATPVWAQKPEAPRLSSDYAILVDAYTGKVLYEKNADDKAYPASTTKILTLITALENSNRKEVVIISERAASMEGSSAYLKAGEKYTFSDILYGMMLPSGNDASVALAEHIGGSMENFVKLMNSSAKLMGAKNSSFVNSSGLPNENHYTTARDMAKIAVYAMQNKAFREIVSTEKVSWPRKNALQPYELRNTNQILGNFFGANGIKTGYTQVAQKCLVVSAKRKDLELIAVFFHSPKDCWDDGRALLQYGFDIVTQKTVYKKDDVVKTLPVYKSDEQVVLTVNEDIILPIVDDYDKYKIEFVTAKRLFAPVKKGQEAGLIRILYDGTEIKKIKLYVKEDFPKK